MANSPSVSPALPRSSPNSPFSAGPPEVPELLRSQRPGGRVPLAGARERAEDHHGDNLDVDLGESAPPSDPPSEDRPQPASNSSRRPSTASRFVGERFFISSRNTRTDAWYSDHRDVVADEPTKPLLDVQTLVFCNRSDVAVKEAFMDQQQHATLCC